MDVVSEGKPNDASVSKKRTRIARPYPTHTLEDTAVIASTIQEKNAGLAFDRVLLAKALGTTPASSGFTMRLNSAAKYGLTQGAYNDDRIAITPRGEAIVAPQRDGERRQALIEAATQPEVFRRFYQALNGRRVPDDAYAQNMLQREFGVHASLTDECLQIIKTNGLYVGIIDEVDGSLHVGLPEVAVAEEQVGADAPPATPGTETPPTEPAEARPAAQDIPLSGRGIFIGHAGNTDIANYVGTVLAPFGIPYRVVECDFDVSRPLAVEVAEEMRNSGAAILIFARPSDDEWAGRREEKRAEKMLYQLGAASALFGEKVISLREDRPGQDPLAPDFHTLGFQQEGLAEVGLALLTELHRMGVIEVRPRQAPP